MPPITEVQPAVPTRRHSSSAEGIPGVAAVTQTTSGRKSFTALSTSSMPRPKESASTIWHACPSARVAPAR